MAESADLTKAEILIVDDTPPNIQLLSAMLHNNGYSVREANNGPTALQSVRSRPPDMVLLDIRMPGMDGYEVCRQIKADERFRSIPVIFVSALDEQTDKIQGFAAGGVDYITKPFQIKEVLARVETHLTLTRLQLQLSVQNQQLQQEIAERLRAEQALHEANEVLEQRVAERTTELVKANQELNNELKERKRVERERELLLAQVRGQAEQVQAIINTVPEGMLLLDRCGKIIVANQAAQAALIDLARFSPNNCLNQLGDRSLDSLLAVPPQGLWHEVKSQDHIFEVIARPMNDAAPSGSSPAPVDSQWVLVLRDVTQQREIDRHLQRQDRLAAVGQMAAGIAHDFNNILAVILLYAEMGMSMPNLPNRLNERLNIIARQAHLAASLIQQILDFSRSAILERQPMNLLSFVKEQIRLLKRTLPENIQIDFQHGPENYVIEADPTRIQQAIMNLSVNARDAMPDGGQLRIHIRQVSAAQEEIHCITCGFIHEKDWVCISVEDSGVGIPPAILPHIFEPFYTTKAPGKGTGLGLAQVFGIAKQHEGHVDVRSTPGQGAGFFLYLPLAQVNTVSPANTPDDQYLVGGGQVILVVEDEPVTQKAIVDGLGMLNYQVKTASNGSEALKVLENPATPVDLVLSDVVMPEMSGIVLFHAIQQRRIDIPVILMSGHPIQDELEKLQADGLQGWLMKPPTIEKLARAVANALK